MKQLNAITEDIIQRAQNGDTEAFSDIYQAYYNKIYFIAMQYFHNEEMAKDIVQEVFIRVYKKMKDLREPKTFNTWIQKVTYTICLNQNRRKLKYVDLGSDLSVEDFKDKNSASTSDKIEEDRVNNIIMNSIEKMSTPLKSVGMLRFYDELQLNEIAEILNIPKGTVNSRVDKIKKLLREDLKNHGVSPKNYSIAFITPAMIYQAYQTLNESYAIAVPVGENVLKTITVASAVKTGSVMIPKLIIGAVVGSVALVGITLLNNSDTNSEELGRTMIVPVENEEIKEVEEVVVEEAPIVETSEIAKIFSISYNQNWTNQPITLDIQLTNEEYDSILINDIDTRTITENGTYNIKLYKDQQVSDERQLVITNIDTQSPTGEFIYYGDYYVLQLNDDISQVDPSSIQFYRDGVQSYDFEYNAVNNTIVIPEKYTTDSFFISDYANNKLEVTVNNKV